MAIFHLLLVNANNRQGKIRTICPNDSIIQGIFKLKKFRTPERRAEKVL
jgi:hypothetical protein